MANTAGLPVYFHCRYAVTPTHNFTFITVKGAGHMVPEFKPVAAFQFLERFFKNEEF